MKLKTKEEAVFWNLKQYDGDFGRNYDKTHIMDFNNYVFQDIHKDINIIKSKLKNSNLKILDIGCGTGKLTLFFIKYFNDSQFFALDLSEVMLDNLKQKVPQKMKNSISYIKSDITEYLKTTNQKFDIIMMSGVLHHFYDYLDVIKLSASILNKEGCLYINIELSDRNFSAFQKYLISLISIQDKYLFLLKKKQVSLLIFSFYLLYSFINFIGPIIRKFIAFQQSSPEHYYSEVHNSLSISKISNILKDNAVFFAISKACSHKHKFYNKLASFVNADTHFKDIRI